MVKNIKNDHETLTEIFAIDYDTNKIDKCVIQGVNLMKNMFHLIIKVMEHMFMVSAGGKNKC